MHKRHRSGGKAKCQASVYLQALELRPLVLDCLSPDDHGQLSSDDITWEHTHLSAIEKGKERKDYTFWHQLDEKSQILYWAAQTHQHYLYTYALTCPISPAGW